MREIFDTKLTFEDHIVNICSKASRKIYAITRLGPYKDLSKRHIVMNVNSQFSYCFLVWMCHNRTTSRRINRLHEKCLHVNYNDIFRKAPRKK